MQALNVVILAAGKGTRMYSAKPKVLHQIAGLSLLQHVVAAAAQLDPERICVVYGHGGDAVPESLGDSSVAFVLQQPQLGTGHAVLAAVPQLVPGGMTLVLYGDVPLIGPGTLQAMARQSGELTLLTTHLQNPHGYGRIIRDERGSIRGIAEEKDATTEQRRITEINTGILLARTDRLERWLASLRNHNAQGEYYLTDIVAMAVEEGINVRSVNPEQPFEVLGVNNKVQLAELERIYQERLAIRLMQQGVTLFDPKRIDVRGQLECGTDVSIDINCVFAGQVRLADGVQVGANCHIKDATVGAGTVIEPFSVIDGATIGADCKVGPYARIRPGTQILDAAHIGNFVEVKNSLVGNGSKANHLSYLGDTDIGAGVNIGAGTITCNYDGANKHRTVIEDNAFIGSDTQLVAPVRVGRGATIGAGSTITRDTPEGGLTLSRSKQMHIAGWQRPTKKR